MSENSAPADSNVAKGRRRTRRICPVCDTPVLPGDNVCGNCFATFCPYCGASPEGRGCTHHLASWNDDDGLSGWPPTRVTLPVLPAHPDDWSDAQWSTALRDAADLAEATELTSGDEDLLCNELLDRLTAPIEKVKWFVDRMPASFGWAWFTPEPAQARAELAALIAPLKAGLQRLQTLEPEHRPERVQREQLRAAQAKAAAAARAAEAAKQAAQHEEYRVRHLAYLEWHVFECPLCGSPRLASSKVGGEDLSPLCPHVVRYHLSPNASAKHPGGWGEGSQDLGEPLRTITLLARDALDDGLSPAVLIEGVRFWEHLPVGVWLSDDQPVEGREWGEVPQGWSRPEQALCHHPDLLDVTRDRQSDGSVVTDHFLVAALPERAAILRDVDEIVRRLQVLRPTFRRRIQSLGLLQGSGTIRMDEDRLIFDVLRGLSVEQTEWLLTRALDHSGAETGVAVGAVRLAAQVVPGYDRGLYWGPPARRRAFYSRIPLRVGERILAAARQHPATEVHQVLANIKEQGLASGG